MIKKILILVFISFSINCQENIKEKLNINLDQIYLELKNKIDNNQDIAPICHVIDAHLSPAQIEIIRQKLITDYKNILESIVKPGLETGVLMPVSYKLDLQEKNTSAKKIYCTAAVIAPNNSYLLLGYINGRIILFDIRNLNNLLKINLNTNSKDAIKGITISPNNKYAISFSASNINIHDIESKIQEPLSSIKTDEDTWSVAINPSNNNILLIGCHWAIIEIWNIEQVNNPTRISIINLRNEFTAYPNTDLSTILFKYNTAVTDIIFSYDQKFILINAQKSFLIKNTDKFEKVKIFDFSTEHSPSTITYFIPLSKYLLCQARTLKGDNTLRLFDLSNLDKEQIISFDQKINLPAFFTVDGNYALLGSGEQLHFYNIKNNFKTKRIISAKKSRHIDCLSANGQYWLKISGGENTQLNDLSSWSVNQFNLHQILLLIQLAKLSTYNNELKNPDFKNVFQQFNSDFQKYLTNYLIKKNIGQYVNIADLINLIEEYGYEEYKK